MQLRYAIVIERARRNYAAYVPDLPGCIATAPTRRGVEKRIREAVELHLAGMHEDGIDPPKPSTSLGWATIPMPAAARLRKAS